MGKFKASAVENSVKDIMGPISSPLKEFKGGPVEYLVAIGSSTGGPKALQRILPAIPGDIPAAIMVVQHMTEGFTKSLANRLDTVCSLKVKEAEHEEFLKPGHCYIAPGGYHMRVVDNRRKDGYSVDLNKGAVVSGHRPSVDVLFESLSCVKAAKTVAVLLTGMGSDGSIGLGKLKASKECYTIAQDKESSVVYGMPGSAIEKGLIDKVISLDNIGGEILKSLEVY